MTRMRLKSEMLALALAGALVGCSDLLEVQNPSAITEDKLKGEAMVSFALNGIKTEFRREYAWVAAMGAAFTDEAWSGHPWSPWNTYDQRDIPTDNAAHDAFTYPLLQRGRGTADALIPKLEEGLGAGAANSPALAEAYAYAGYAYVLVADHLCSASLGLGLAPVGTAELYGEAVKRFEKAIQIASAAGAEGASARDLAKVGLARAHLNLGDKPKAIAAATGVPAEFSAWVRYVDRADNDWGMYNFFSWWAGDKFNEVNLVLDPTAFTAIQDRRVPYDPTPKRLLDGTRDGLLPFQSSSFSDWAPDKKVTFKQSASIRFASGLEAQYIIAEAGGLSSTALRAFINTRRAIGGQALFPGADAQLFRELLDQRFLDFFLDGHRTGDLRRYKRSYQLDLWPKGQMPGLNRAYGSAECWPMSISELNGNPAARTG
jgi:hypothetical protein